MSKWIGQVPTDTTPYYGFVYKITNLYNGHIYIGKKFFHKTITRKPLKGMKRRRKEIVDSDWKDYWGSSNELLSDYAKQEGRGFERTILRCCVTRWECNYYEVKAQIDNQVLLRKDCYNGIIRTRIPKAPKHLLKDTIILEVQHES